MIQFHSSTNSLAIASSTRLLLFSPTPLTSSDDPARCIIDGMEQAHEGKIVGICFGPEGKVLASICDAKVVKLWCCKTGKVLSQRVLPKKPSAITFGSIGGSEEKPKVPVLIVADRVGDVSAMSVPDITSNYQLLCGHTGSIVTQTLVTSNLKYLVTADRDEKIRVSHFPSTNELKCFCLGHSTYVTAIHELSGCSDTLISGDGNGNMAVWKLSEGTLTQKVLLPECGGDVAALQRANEKKEKRKGKKKNEKCTESEDVIPQCIDKIDVISHCSINNVIAVLVSKRSMIFCYKVADEGVSPRISHISTIPIDISKKSVIRGIVFVDDGSLLVQVVGDTPDIIQMKPKFNSEDNSIVTYSPGSDENIAWMAIKAQWFASQTAEGDIVDNEINSIDYGFERTSCGDLAERKYEELRVLTEGTAKRERKEKLRISKEKERKENAKKRKISSVNE